MWVTFFVDSTSPSGITFSSYQVEGEPAENLARDATTATVVKSVLQRASISREELLETGSARLALQLDELEDWVLKPSRRRTVQKEASVEVSIFMNLIEQEQRQMTQQTISRKRNETA